MFVTISTEDATAFNNDGKTSQSRVYSFTVHEENTSGISWQVYSEIAVDLHELSNLLKLYQVLTRK